MVGSSQLRRVLAAAVLLAAGGEELAAQPAVVATSEGQIGETPGALDKVQAPDFAPLTLPGALAGDVALARIDVSGLVMPPPPEVAILVDHLHSPILPLDGIDFVAVGLDEVDKVAPSLEAFLGDLTRGVVSFAEDGSTSGKMSLRLASYDFASGALIADLGLDDIDFDVPFPDEGASSTDSAVDEQSRAATVFTEVPSGVAPKVRLQTWDAVADELLDLIDVNDGAIDPEIALLKPDGTRLVVASVDPVVLDIQLNLLDLGGPAPVVEPEIDVTTTTAPFGNFRPAVAADPATGAFTVCWDHVTAATPDPSDIRARRFDAGGNPLGDDFRVNVPPLIGDDVDQGQCDVAVGPGGLTVFAWAAAGATGAPDTDVFARAFLADGSAITGGALLTLGQFRVNTGDSPGGPLSDRQDRPKVRWLPEPDASGRPQFAVAWRDVGDGTGADPNGTGTSVRCFAVDGLDELPEIFSDGFESGDTSSWSSATP